MKMHSAIRVAGPFVTINDNGSIIHTLLLGVASAPTCITGVTFPLDEMFSYEKSEKLYEK
jgi:hypothetical protein